MLTKEQNEIFRLMYLNEPRENIFNKFHWKNWHAVKEYARRKGFHRNKDIFNSRRGTIAPLLEENNNSYYWMGFILADGCFQKNGQLVITCAIKDKSHLEKLAIFLNSKIRKFKVSKSKNYIENGWYRNPFSYRVTVLETKLYKSVMNKFDLKFQKTYNPPNFDYYKNLDYNKVFSLFIGIVDGDGSIAKVSKQIKIEVHASWEKFYIELANFLGFKYTYKVNKKGYFSINFSATERHKILSIANKLCLPKMDRKWSRLV